MSLMEQWYKRSEQAPDHIGHREEVWILFYMQQEATGGSQAENDMIQLFSNLQYTIILPSLGRQNLYFQFETIAMCMLTC